MNERPQPGRLGKCGIDMGDHDIYGKSVMRQAAGSSYHEGGPSCYIDYGTAMPARIDGTIDDSIAVEIESRTSKQVRGAVLDLICHPYPKKLLVLIPKHMKAATTEGLCRNALGRFVDEKDFSVVSLTGTGHQHQLEQDVLRVRTALQRLGAG